MVFTTGSERIIHIHVYRALKWADVRRGRRGAIHFDAAVLYATKNGLTNHIETKYDQNHLSA
jgi:hypothetical protein